MPDLDVPPAAVAALWAAVGVWLAWWFVPLLVSAAGGTRYANGGAEDPAALEPDGSDPAYAAAFDALRRLGYEPLGPGWMRLTFHLRDWTYRTTVRAFRKRSAGRFAFLHELPVAPGWHQLIFATCWADGGLDLTAASAPDSYTADDGFAMEAVATADPAAVEARHADRVAAHEAAGRRRDTDLSLRALLEATGRHAGPSTITPTARTARVEVVAAGGPLAVATAAAVLVFGPWSWAVPAALLAVLTGLWVLTAVARANAAAQLRRAAEPPDEGW
ncbi:MAG: hypothetical protein U0804_04275 [Gemmataceae bacterium]